MHSVSGDPNSPRPLLLFPDVFMEVGDIVWQLCDDPFEVKLRANYEVCANSCMVTFSGSLYYLNGEVFVERVRNKSTQNKKSKKSGIKLGFKPKTFGILVIKPLGPLAEERKTTYISSIT